MYLICEGPCNPSLRAVDDAVMDRRESERLEDGSVVPNLPSDIRVELGRLVHTEHLRVGPDTQSCVACGTHRRFGNTI